MSFGSRKLDPMNAEEQARRDACVAAGCEACHALGLPRAEHCGAVEYNHRLSGGVTVGHRWGYPLGEYHHQGKIPRGQSIESARAKYGPNRRDEKSSFHARFGSDQTLQNSADDRIGHPREEMPSRRELREQGGQSKRKASKCGPTSKTFPRPERWVP